MAEKPDVHVFDTLDDLASGLADAVAREIDDAVRSRGRCSIALSGGSTPVPLHRILATRFRESIPWSDVHVFWGDERYVSADHVLSNYRMAKETLLDHVPCPAGNVHPMPTHLTNPMDAAGMYEATLREYFDGEWPRFDVMLLGIGADGHTASLFPGSESLEESTRWALAVTTPAEPAIRLTLTLPVLNRSTGVHFMVAGASKASAVRAILAGRADPADYPAAGVQPVSRAAAWWLDREAARELPG